MSANAKLQIIIDARDQTKGAFSGVENALKGLGEHGKTAGAALGSMATQVAAVGAVIGGAVVAGVGKAVGVFADFEHGMSGVAATGTEAKARLGELSAEALRLGQDTSLAGISATDAATAMAELARSGVSVSDQLAGATQGALLLASAGAISVGEASSIAAKAMNVFGMEGSQVAHVADVLSAGANKSATDVHQLGAAFNQSASVAKDAGLSFEELTGTLALLAQKGVEGSDAGTALRTTIQRLTAPTKEAHAVMDDLGISIFDASGKMKPWPEIVDNLKAAFAGLTDEQRASALQTIGGADAVRVLIPLMKEGGGAVRTWTAAVNDQGNAARTGAALNDNLAGSIDQLKAVFQTAAIQVGSKFAPAIRTAADELGKFVTKAMASPEVTKALEDLGNKGAAALTALLAKVSDPAFQNSLKEWGTAALNLVRDIQSLASWFGDHLGPAIRLVSDPLGNLIQQNKEAAVGFGLVAAAAIGFRSELSTLLSVGNSVIKMFAEKAAAKATLTGANNTLAGSAGRTATAFAAVRTAAAAAAPVILDLAAGTAVSAAGAVAVSLGFAAAANAMDQSKQRAKDNTQAWTAAAFALANGATEANGAVFGFTNLVVSQNAVGASAARLSVIWNEYVAGLQRSGQSTDTLGLHLIDLAQFITGQVAPAFEGINNTAAPFNNTLAGLGVGAKTLAASMAAIPPGVSAVDQALGAVVISSANVGIGMGTAAASMGAVVAAAGPVTDYSVSASAALNDLNTFGNSAAQGLNAAASAALGAAMALSEADRVIQGLGTTAGTLQGYLRPLQAQWDELNKVTENGAHVTAAQQAEYARLSPAIQYLNAQIGANQSQTVTATLAAIANYQAVQTTGASYLAAGLAAGVSAGQVAVSGAVATASGAKFADLTAKIQAVPTAITTAVDSRSAVVAAGQMAGLRIAVVSVPTEINITAHVDISGALGALETLRNNMPHSPAKEGPFRVLPDWTKVFDTFGEGVTRAIGELPRLHDAVDSATADLQSKIASAASSVAKAVTDTLGALAALSSFDFVANSPSGATLGWFAHLVTSLVATIEEASRGFSAEGLKAAGAFADAAGKVGGFIKNALDGLGALAAYDFAQGSPSGSALGWFAHLVTALVATIAEASRGFTEEALKAASAFADSAGKVAGLIGPALDGLSKLAGFVAPSSAAVDAFAVAIGDVMVKIAAVATQLSADGIAQAGLFGTAANSVLGALKTGLDVFTGLAKLVVPSAKAIDDFASAIAYTVSRIGTIADQLGQDGIKRAQEFGQSVQTIFGALKSAMDVLTNLEKFKDVAEKALGSLAAGLVTAIEFAQGMVNQSKDLVLQAEEYANNMKKAAALFASGQALGSVGGEEIGRRLGESVISGARDALGANSPSDELAKVGRDIDAGLVQGMSDGMQDAVKKAADIASAVAKAITDTLGAATALGKLNVATLPTGGQITGILAFTRALVAEMAAASTLLSEDGAKATTLFADAASKVASTVSAGLAALTGLVAFVAPAKSAIFDFGKSLRLAVNDLIVLAEEIPIALAEQAALFSEQASKAIAVFGAGVSGFTSLIGYVRPVARSLYDFGKDLRLAVQDFAAIVDIIGQEVADNAGKFGEVAAKAVAAIGGGAEAFRKLDNYARVTKGAIFAFGKDLMMLIADFAAIVDLVGVEAAKKAGEFADGAGKAVAVVGTALGSFAGLSTFVTPGRAAVDGLLATIRYIIARFGEMAAVMSTEGTKQLGDFGAATNAVLGGVKAAIDTFIALDKAVVPQTGDLSDLVVAVQGVTRNMATAAAALGDDAIKDATAFGTAANGIFTALKAGLDLFTQIDKPGTWPTTDWLQPLVELMAGVLLRGGQLLSQSEQLKAIADQFAANLLQAGATFGGALGLGEWALTGNVGGGAGAGASGTTINNYYTVTGNTLLSKDTATQQMVSGVVTATQGRTIGYATSG